MITYSVKLKGNLQRVHKDGNVSLHFLVIINRKSKTIPLDLKWPAANINNDEGRITPRRKNDADYNDYMLIINQEKNKIMEIFKLYRIQDQPLDMDRFLYEIEHFNRRKDFLVYMKLKLEARYKDKEISKKTYTNGMSTYNRLKLFKEFVPFYSLTSDFLRAFAAFLKKKFQNDIGLIWTRIKDIKTYVHIADDEGIHVPKDFKKFKNIEPKSAIVYLETDELERLMKLFNSKTLPQIEQDILQSFLWASFSSLRISDVRSANWSWMSIDNNLTFVPAKNKRFGKEVVVPLSPLAVSLIKRKSGLFFDIPTDQEINRTLKTIAVKAKIEKVLTTHVARHTFGTHYYRQTKDVVALQKIMGHSKIETTMIYVHVNEVDKRNGVDKMCTFFKNIPAFLRVAS